MQSGIAQRTSTTDWHDREDQHGTEHAKSQEFTEMQRQTCSMQTKHCLAISTWHQVVERGHHRAISLKLLVHACELLDKGPGIGVDRGSANPRTEYRILMSRSEKSRTMLPL